MTFNLPHYPTFWARRADFIIHLVGIVFALFGGGLLLGLAISNGLGGKIAAASVYAFGLVAMLSFSLAYNFAKPDFQPFLRRLDHAGIFLMIAASYTPFTTQVLHGNWAIIMTSVVWTLAILGMAGKLFLPGLGKIIWVIFYLALGWAALIALKPMMSNMPLAATILLGVGGLLYSVGTIFYVSKTLKYRRAIWHGHVVAAAIVHYVAILVGVVLH
ncbi:PAQR family membrane homeostasis protein TrhA [Pseudaquidulcibacter saccharophilus]|uniref:PAQR family membrane homeostasis protein TrhA n=1 Tax=Pseudaquidulcibacter saccharophilus TaxID=2831900 RepID=UPI001EFEF8D1|nr:hemolysin III family protein [Pseudaquidulcibacter saccharophilus]